MKKTLLSQKRDHRFPWRGKRGLTFTFTETYSPIHDDFFESWIGFLVGDQQSPLDECPSIVEGNRLVQESCQRTGAEILEVYSPEMQAASPSDLQRMLTENIEIARWYDHDDSGYIKRFFAAQLPSNPSQLFFFTDGDVTRCSFVPTEIVRRRNRDRTKALRCYEVTGFYHGPIGDCHA